MNNKTTNILLGILIVTLVIIGIILIKINFNNKNNPIIEDTMNSKDADSFDELAVPNPKLEDMVGYDGAPLGVKPVFKKTDWETTSKESLAKLIGDNSDLYYENKLMLNFSQSVDLTGDNVSEGVFGFPYGNGDMYYIFMNKNGENINAQSKDLGGKISSVSLFNKSTVMYQVGFKLLPNENGYYIFSKNYNEKIDKQECENGGVIAYQWNSNTSLFEYNNVLTTKYTAIECK